MKSSTIVWTIIAIVIIGGAIWWFTIPGMSMNPNMPANETSGGTVTTTTSTTTTTSGIPGNNLALGENTNASVGTYLVAYNGMTLYTYSSDTAEASKCTSSCATTWPPYTVSSGSNLVAELPITGMLGTINRADGSLQLTYNGKPLYFYSGDTASGQVNGRGVGGFAVAKP